MFIEFNIKQVYGNLISNIFDCPNFYPIYYVRGGLFDRFKNEATTMVEQDWNPIYINDKHSFYSVKLEQPKSNDLLVLKLKAYKKDSIIGFTYSDGEKLIYPFIETNHKWVKKDKNYYCSNCNIKGWSCGKFIIPDSLIDCNLFIVKEIIC
jgi:hypothetical protein